MNTRSYAVEAICNTDKEPERLKTLQPILTFYNIQASCKVWGEEARAHELFPIFRTGTQINAISLAINHIEILKKYKDKDMYLLILESDALPIYNLEKVHQHIESTIEEMKEHSIDASFIGEGCFRNMNPVNPPVPIEKKTATLYITPNSRCTESYIISPRCIHRFLQFIESFPMTAIDFSFNFFFQNTGTVSSWRIPELFQQGSHTGLYKGSIVASTL